MKTWLCFSCNFEFRKWLYGILAHRCFLWKWEEGDETGDGILYNVSELCHNFTSAWSSLYFWSILWQCKTVLSRIWVVLSFCKSDNYTGVVRQSCMVHFICHVDTNAVLSCADMEEYAGDLYWVSLPIHCVPVTTSVTNESVHRQRYRPLLTGCYLWRACSFFVLYTDPFGQSVRWEWEVGCVGYMAYLNPGCSDGGMWTIWDLNRVMQ